MRKEKKIFVGVTFTCSGCGGVLEARDYENINVTCKRCRMKHSISLSHSSEPMSNVERAFLDLVPYLENGGRSHSVTDGRKITSSTYKITDVTLGEGDVNTLSFTLRIGGSDYLLRGTFKTVSTSKRGNVSQVFNLKLEQQGGREMAFYFSSHIAFEDDVPYESYYKEVELTLKRYLTLICLEVVSKMKTSLDFGAEETEKR